MQLCFDLENTRAAGCDLRIGFLLLAARRGLRKLVKLRLKAFQLVLKLRDLRKLRRVQIEARAGLIDQIDSLVGQKAVGDIALTHLGGAAAHLVRHGNTVEGFVIGTDALENFCGLGNRRFPDVHRLKTAFQSGILFDVFAVFLERGRADDLNIAARESRLENICSIHRAFGVTCTDNIVHLVDDENDVADLFDLVDQTLHAALELAAELCTRNQCGQVEQMDLLVAHLKRNAALVDAHGKSLRDSSLADARLTDQAGIILLAAVENLNDAVGLAVASDDVVNAALSGLLGQVFAVIVKILALFVVAAAAALVAVLRALLRRTGRGGGCGHGVGLVRRFVVPAVTSSFRSDSEPISPDRASRSSSVMPICSIMLSSGLTPSSRAHLRHRPSCVVLSGPSILVMNTTAMFFLHREHIGMFIIG